MKSFLRSLPFAACMAVAMAADIPKLPAEWTTPDGQVLENPVVQKWDAAFVTVLHDGGVTRVEIAKMPADFQAAFGYNAASAAEAAQNEAASREQAAQKIAAKAQAAKERDEKLRAQTALENRPKVKISGEVLQVLSDGILVQCDEVSYIPVASSMGSIGGGGGSQTRKVSNEPRAEGLVFLAGHPGQSSLVDGKSITAYGIEEGRYQYTTTVGSEKTIQRYTFAAK